MIHFLDGSTLTPYDHPYNTTALNERAVELAMFERFREVRHNWEGRMGTCLEVGNVLSHYDDIDYLLLPDRRVVDRFEEAPGVENIDVFDIEGTYDTIVSISTIEHVGVDDGRNNPGDAVYALYFLRSLLAPGGRFFCTFPTGWNRCLDAALRSSFVCLGSLSETFMVRDGEDWVEGERNVNRGFNPLPYGVTQPWAEAVWVGEFGPL